MAKNILQLFARMPQVNVALFSHVPPYTFKLPFGDANNLSSLGLYTRSTKETSGILKGAIACVGNPGKPREMNVTILINM